MDSLPEKNECGLSFHADAVMPLILERLAAGQTVRNLGFRGVSMMPMLRQGKDSVEIVPLPGKLKKYDLPLYSRGDGMYVMHRIVEVREDCYICLGDNTYHYEKIAPEQMVALVSAFMRGKRRVSTENRAYRLYCRIWCALYPVRRPIKLAEWRLKGLIKRLLKRWRKKT